MGPMRELEETCGVGVSCIREKIIVDIVNAALCKGCSDQGTHDTELCYTNFPSKDDNCFSSLKGLECVRWKRTDLIEFAHSSSVAGKYFHLRVVSHASRQKLRLG